MPNEINNSPAELIPIITQIVNFIEDPNSTVELKGFESFQDLGANEGARKLRIIFRKQTFDISLQHIVRRNGDSIYIYYEGSRLIQYVFKYYLRVESDRVLFFHDGRINGIKNLTNEVVLNDVPSKDKALVVHDGKIILGDYPALELSDAEINNFLSNLINYAFIRDGIRQEYLEKNGEDFGTQYEDVNYWLYAPGENAHRWEEFYTAGIIALGWDALGNLDDYDNKMQIADALKKKYGGNTSKSNDASANFDLAYSLNLGDIVIVKKGRGTLLGYGEVISDYYFDDKRSDFNSCRKVKWIKKGEWKVDHALVLKTLTNITGYDSGIVEGKDYHEYLLDIMNDGNLQQSKKQTKDLSPMALNQILYGPPGTGKTYHTISKALSIIESKSSEELAKEERAALKERYQGYVDKGQIVFTTFHQSMSYEDFVEGIKPKTINEKVVYEVEPGIFKNICDKALSTKGNFDEVLERFELHTAEGVLEKPFTIKSKATNFDIEYRGTNVFYVQPHSSTKENAWYPVNIENIRKAFETGIYEKIYNSTYVREIIAYLEREYKLRRDIGVGEEPHILIIDEINRGNVSAIFGELITLIEESKRAGKPEALEVTLPYSKQKFSVPSNLYIIGTMNTADRSVEALDTALRRRFAFMEMMPEPELIRTDGILKGVNGMLEIEEGVKINLVNVLETINKRITALLDADHQIGHSYFINVRSIKELVGAFNNCIIPLLKEYFYHDEEKIALVLGEGFVTEEQKEIDNDIFRQVYSIRNPQPRPRFKIKTITEDDLVTAIKLLLPDNA